MARSLWPTYVREVAEVDPEPDHRRLVRDRVGAAHGAVGDGGVAQIALDPLRPRSEVGGPLAVRGRQERVDHADVVAGRQQRVDDVRADEPGAAGHEDHRCGL